MLLNFMCIDTEFRRGIFFAYNDCGIKIIKIALIQILLANIVRVQYGKCQYSTWTSYNRPMGIQLVPTPLAKALLSQG